MIDPRLNNDIDSSESCVLHSYKDSKGLWTIGWGHLIEPQPTADPKLIWTKDRADAQRDRDVASAIEFASHLWEWPSLDTDCRRNALVELCFNMRGRWLEFVDTRAALRARDWQGARDGLLHSLWAAEVHPTRSNRLANYFLTGQYPEGV